MRTSETIKELNAALAAAVLEFPPIEKGRTAKVRMKSGGEYSYDYADLADILSAVRKPLAKQGLTISHDCRVTYDPLKVETVARLDHSSGEWKESSPLPLPCDGLMSATQQIGSACTYGRRYTTQDILGISTETDDDGNAAADLDAHTTPRQQSSSLHTGGPHPHRDKPKNGAAAPAPMKEASPEYKAMKDSLLALGVPDGKAAHAEAVTKFAAGKTVKQCFDNPDDAKLVCDRLFERQGNGETCESIYHDALEQAGLLEEAKV